MSKSVCYFYMLLNTKDLTGVRVETKSGIKLGKLASFNMHAETGRMVSLLVRTSRLASVLPEELLIDWHLVMSMEPDRIVVADAYLAVAPAHLQKQFASFKV